MFLKLVLKSFKKNTSRKILALLIVALGTTAISAMANIWIDVENKVGQELRAFGSNIVIRPKPIVKTGLGDAIEDEKINNKNIYLDESDLKNLKTIFWRNNIVAFAPYLERKAHVIHKNKNVETAVMGTWFHKKIEIDTGETVITGISALKRYWTLRGRMPRDNASNVKYIEAAIGKRVAQRLKIDKDQILNVNFGDKTKMRLKIVGIFDGSFDENKNVYVPIHELQKVLDLDNKFSFGEISAITTPDNDLAHKYNKDSRSLTSKEYEIWYCTAFVDSISIQAQETIKGSEARPIRQISDSDGLIIKKINYLMLIFMVFAFIIAALGIWNLSSSYVVDRCVEIGLSKAVGAKNLSLISLFSVESTIIGLAGGLIGALLGSAISLILGYSIFQKPIDINLFAILISVIVSVLIALVGNIASILSISKLEIKDVLHANK